MSAHAERVAKMWQNLLGFMPEKIAETDDHSDCFNCKSKNIQSLESPPWTSKNKCGDCGYYTYIIYQDKMGTVMPDDVAIDKRDSNMIPVNP